GRLMRRRPRFRLRLRAAAALCGLVFCAPAGALPDAGLLDRALRIEQARGTPSSLTAPALRLYVANPAKRWTLIEMQLTIDGRSHRHAYSNEGAAALQA